MNKEQLEQFYTNEDPWGFKTHPDDKKRRDKIVKLLKGLKIPFKKALDIGCGEGFITEKLPAKELYGYEVSDLAAERLPKNVKRITELNGKYDLIIATGVLYSEYDVKALTDAILSLTEGIVLTSHIKDLEVNNLPEDKIIHTEEYKYREYTQKLNIYQFKKLKNDVSTTQPKKKPVKRVKNSK